MAPMNSLLSSPRARTLPLSMAFPFALALAMSLALDAPSAHAEVRKADIIAGSTVEQRGLTVAACPSIEAERAILIDSEGTVLFERNAQDRAQIASITKVMTAIVAIDKAAADTHVAVSESAASIGESSANLQQGDVLDFEAALKALLVPSGNDAALAIAETVGSQMISADPSLGKDPVRAFVAAMNDKAAEIGCSDTVYENPHGLDDEEYAGNLHSTAADQAKVAQCAMSYDQIREIVGGGSTKIGVLRDGSQVKVKLETTDDLLEMYSEAIGIKTGVTDLAGPSFMGAAASEGRELYVVVLDSTDEWQRFDDARRLFEWAFEHVSELPLANTAEMASMQTENGKVAVPVVAEVSHLDWIDKGVKATLAEPDASVSVFDIEGNVTQSFEFDELHGNVSAGDKVGRVVFKQRNLPVAEQDLVAVEDVAAPNGIDALGIGWQRLLGGFQGEPASQESRILNVMPLISDNKTNAA